MSKVMEKYFQECDLCRKIIELPNKITYLSRVRLPCKCVTNIGNISSTTAEFSLCDDCFLELKNFLNTKYEITHNEYCSPYIGKVYNGKGE